MKGGAWRWLAAACGSLTLVIAHAQDQDEDSPDLDFLEYLGAWDESDEEWLAVSEWEGAGSPERERSRDIDTEVEADDGADDEH